MTQGQTNVYNKQPYLYGYSVWWEIGLFVFCLSKKVTRQGVI